MAESEERRILGLLAAGQLSADEASEVLGALRDDAPPSPPRPRPTARNLRIRIETEDDGAQRSRINVNLPLGLAKFAGQLLPEEAKDQLERHGIDLEGVLGSLGDDLPEGPLVDFEAGDDDYQVHFVIEVV